MQPDLFSKLTKDRDTEKTHTYDSPFALYILYIFKSIVITGGVGTGQDMRFEPFSGIANINLSRENESARNFLRNIIQLQEDTKLARGNFDKVIDSDDTSMEWASSISEITRNFISATSGGVLGLGELLAHHVIGILSLGG